MRIKSKRNVLLSSIIYLNSCTQEEYCNYSLMCFAITLKIIYHEISLSRNFFTKYPEMILKYTVIQIVICDKFLEYYTERLFN